MATLRATTSAQASSTTITGNKPTGTVEDDLMVAFVVIPANRTITAVPTGWTLVDPPTVNRASTFDEPYLLTYYKIAGASEPASYDWTRSNAAGGHNIHIVTIEKDTYDAVGLWTDRDEDSSGTGSTSHNVPSSTNGAGDLHLIISSNVDNTGTTTFTGPGGYTEEGDVCFSAGTLRTASGLYSKALPTAGTTGAQTITASQAAFGWVSGSLVVANLADQTVQLGIASDAASALPLFPTPAPATATPELMLATRAPAIVSGALPTSAPYIEAATLASAALLEHTTGGSDDLDFTGTFRLEFDATLPDDGASYVLAEAHDNQSSRTTIKVEITGAPTRSVIFTIDDGSTTDTITAYATPAGRAAGRGSRIGIAVSFDTDGAVTIETAARNDDSPRLASAAWTVAHAEATTLTSIDNPGTTRRWRIDLGTDRARVIEARIVPDGVTAQVIYPADSTAPLGSTESWGGVTWTVDGNAELQADGDWDNITSHARIPEGGISARYGRNSDQGLHLAGELEAVLDNSARDFEPEHTGSPYYPAVRPLTPVRFRAIYAGTTYAQHRGFAQAFEPEYDHEFADSDSITPLSSVDAFNPLANFDTGGALGATLAALSPIALWPLTDTGATLDDTEGTSHLTPTSIAQGYASPFWGNRRKVASFDGNASLAEDTSADAAVELTGDFSIAFAIRQSPGGDYHICSAYGTGGAYWGLELDCATSQAPIVRLIRNDGTPTDAGNDITLDLDYGHFSDGRPHIVVATYASATNTAKVYTAEREVGSSTDAIPAGNGTPTVSGTPVVRVGNEGTHGSGAGIYQGLLGYLAIFDTVLTADQALTITRCVIDGFAEQTPAARINALLDAYPWPTEARNIDSAATIEPSTEQGSIRGTASGFYAGIGVGTTITVSTPPEAIAGDTLYVGITIPGNRTITNVPNGWTLVRAAESGSTFTDVRLRVYRLDSWDGTTPSWDFARSNEAGDASWVLAALGDVNPAETAVADGNGTSTALLAPGVTAAAGDVLLTFHGTLSTTATLRTTEPPAGMVELADVNSPNTGSTQRANLAVNAETGLDAGATGDRTATRSGSEVYATVTIAADAAAAAATAGSLAPKDMSDQSLLAELQAVAEAELGEFFIDPQGRPTFRGRDWRTTNANTVEAIFGDVDGEKGYRDLRLRYGNELIINEFTVTDADGNTYTAADRDSIEQYGRRSSSATLDLTGADAASAYAQKMVALYAQPRLNVAALDIWPAADPDSALFPAVLGRELGDRLEVRRRPPGWTSGPYIAREFHVEAIEISVVRGSKDWTARFTGSPAT